MDVDLDLMGFQVRAINGAFTAELQSDLKPQKEELRAGIDTPIAKSNLASNSVSNPTSSTTSSPSVTPAATQSSTIVELYSQIEFTPNLRPGLVAGSVKLRFGAAGTDYYDSFREYLKPGSDGASVTGSASVFATGTLGEWAFTGAYNSARALNTQEPVADSSYRNVFTNLDLKSGLPVNGQSTLSLTF